MRFYQGKFSLPLIFGLLLTGLHTVSAQEKQSAKISFGETKLSTPKIDLTVDESVAFLDSGGDYGKTDSRLNEDSRVAVEKEKSAESPEFKYQFHPVERRKRNFDFDVTQNQEII